MTEFFQILSDIAVIIQFIIWGFWLWKNKALILKNIIKKEKTAENPFKQTKFLEQTKKRLDYKA